MFDFKFGCVILGSVVVLILWYNCFAFAAANCSNYFVLYLVFTSPEIFSLIHNKLRSEEVIT